MPREYEPPTPEILRWVALQVHRQARVSEVVALAGGITADMDRLTVDSPAGATDVVLRRWPAESWREDLVTREASALAAVRGSGVPAPELLAMDADGAETGVRCTLTSALAGSAGPGSGRSGVLARAVGRHAGVDSRCARAP